MALILALPRYDIPFSYDESVNLYLNSLGSDYHSINIQFVASRDSLHGEYIVPAIDALEVFAMNKREYDALFAPPTVAPVVQAAAITPSAGLQNLQSALLAAAGAANAQQSSSSSSSSSAPPSGSVRASLVSLITSAAEVVCTRPGQQICHAKST